MDRFRQGKNQLTSTLEKWDRLIPGRGVIHLIACGGSALTLLGYKESTKDVDFIVPVEAEYDRLVDFLRRAGYKQSSDLGWIYPGENIIYDLYKGKRVFTTELLESPLNKGGNKKVLRLKRIYLGVLNSIDWVITKMFRGDPSDVQDCVALAQHERIDLKELERRFRETASFDVSEKKALKNLELILNELKKIKREII